jgi:hypothetical protein
MDNSQKQTGDFILKRDLKSVWSGGNIPILGFVLLGIGGVPILGMTEIDNIISFQNASGSQLTGRGLPVLGMIPQEFKNEPEYQLMPKAWLDEITACFNNNKVIITVKGNTPTPGYLKEIKRNLITIYPPEFLIRYSKKPGIFEEKITPFELQTNFHAKQNPGTIILYCQDKKIDVSVTDSYEVLSDSIAEGAKHRFEATGMSSNGVFHEAFNSALNQLSEGIFDELLSVRIASIEGQFGGIAGLNELSVTVDKNENVFEGSGKDMNEALSKATMKAFCSINGDGGHTPVKTRLVELFTKSTAGYLGGDTYEVIAKVAIIEILPVAETGRS